MYSHTPTHSQNLALGRLLWVGRGSHFSGGTGSQEVSSGKSGGIGGSPHAHPAVTRFLSCSGHFWPLPVLRATPLTPFQPEVRRRNPSPCRVSQPPAQEASRGSSLQQGSNYMGPSLHCHRVQCSLEPRGTGWRSCLQVTAGTALQ